MYYLTYIMYPMTAPNDANSFELDKQVKDVIWEM